MLRLTALRADSLRTVKFVTFTGVGEVDAVGGCAHVGQA